MKHSTRVSVSVAIAVCVINFSLAIHNLIFDHINPYKTIKGDKNGNS